MFSIEMAAFAVLLFAGGGLVTTHPWDHAQVMREKEIMVPRDAERLSLDDLRRLGRNNLFFRAAYLDVTALWVFCVCAFGAGVFLAATLSLGAVSSLAVAPTIVITLMMLFLNQMLKNTTSKRQLEEPAPQATGAKGSAGALPGRQES